MNVTCPHCSTKLNLPEDKVPRHRDSSFKCPKCKGAIQVKASQPIPPPEPPGVQSNGLFRRSSREQALVCMPSSPVRDELTSTIKRLGFSVDFPDTPLQAFKNLEYHNYPLVVVEDAFDPDRQMAIHMNEMDMSLRRRICLVRVCQTEATGNDMAALHSSVNSVISGAFTATGPG